MCQVLSVCDTMCQVLSLYVTVSAKCCKCVPLYVPGAVSTYNSMCQVLSVRTTVRAKCCQCVPLYVPIAVSVCHCMCQVLSVKAQVHVESVPIPRTLCQTLFSPASIFLSYFSNYLTFFNFFQFPASPPSLKCRNILQQKVPNNEPNK